MPYKDPDVRRHKQKAYAAAYYQKTKEETKKRSKKKRLRMREEWHAFKATLYCTKCGFNHSAALDFHHIDPSTKTGSVNALVSNGRYARAMKELEKCVVLCANCHRIHHHDELHATKKKKKKGAEAP
jgi:NADPH-dependent glutamate synthase beta subunit-like oxidoreductase